MNVFNYTETNMDVNAKGLAGIILAGLVDACLKQKRDNKKVSDLSLTPFLKHLAVVVAIENQLISLADMMSMVRHIPKQYCLWKY